MAGSQSDNPIVRGLQLLTTGWGYNFYNDANRARADDLLIREKSAHYLSDAVASLSSLETGYRQAFIPGATRESPYPPADDMERLRAIGRLKARVNDLGVRLRGAAAPAQDKIWFRVRSEQDLLYRLLASDQSMVGSAQEIAEVARTVTADSWHADPSGVAAPLDHGLHALDEALRARQELLMVPTF